MHSQEIAGALDSSPITPVKIVFKPVLTTPESVYQLCLEANSSANCVGLIMWMHTFSPAKMWIPGLKALRKPFVHLHMQFNRELPWATFDKVFIHLITSAHSRRGIG